MVQIKSGIHVMLFVSIMKPGFGVFCGDTCKFCSSCYTPCHNNIPCQAVSHCKNKQSWLIPYANGN